MPSGSFIRETVNNLVNYKCRRKKGKAIKKTEKYGVCSSYSDVETLQPASSVGKKLSKLFKDKENSDSGLMGSLAVAGI